MMNIVQAADISLAITGSGGAGAITAGEMLLTLAGKSGCYGMMRRSFGPQIRGGEAAALIRMASIPVECMNDGFNLLLALDWRNAERFSEEIHLYPNSVILADPKAGAVPDIIAGSGATVVDIPLKELAAEVEGGRPNMVALGVLTHWLGFDSERARALIHTVFGKKGAAVVEGSVGAFERGLNYHSDDLDRVDEFRVLPPANDYSQHWKFSGNEGCGLGALRGGIRFAAAYPITPASDLLEWLAPRLEKLGGSLVQAEDELASINMIIGSSFGGVPSLTATSGPGLALMTEGMGLAVASEVPVVVINVMRGGPSTGIPTKSEQSDLNMALYGLHGDAPHLVLAPLDHADSILTTEWAVRLAEALQTVAVVLSDQNLAQSRALLPKPEYELPDIPARKAAESADEYLRYQLTEDGVSPMSIPGEPERMYVADGLEHTQSGRPTTAAADHSEQLDKRRDKLETFDFGDHWASCRGEGKTAIITWGSTTAAVREAAARLEHGGYPVRVIAIRLLMPASPEKLTPLLEDVERILVVEQSHSEQFWRYLRAFYDLERETRVMARPGPLPIGPGEIVREIEGWT